MSNRFAECTDVVELIFQTVGAASVTWNAAHGNEVFNTAEAERIAEECLEILRNGSRHIPALTPSGAT